MKTLPLAAAFFVVFFPHFGQAQETCEIQNDMNVCTQPEPLKCETANNYERPRDFADAYGAELTAYQPDEYGNAMLRLTFLEEDGSLKANFVFTFDIMSRDICLVVIATPLKQPSGMAL